MSFKKKNVELPYALFDSKSTYGVFTRWTLDIGQAARCH